MRFLIVGLDAAGKTTLLYKLKLGEVVTTIPTIGFNVETVVYKKHSIVGWDVGGRGGIRLLARHYLDGADAIMFVVDSNDTQRLEQAAHELVILTKNATELPVLVVANKQDLPAAISPKEVSERMKLQIILKDRIWCVLGLSTMTKDVHLEYSFPSFYKKAFEYISYHHKKRQQKNSAISQNWAGTLSSLMNPIKSYFARAKNAIF